MADIISPRVFAMINNELTKRGETWSDFIRRFHKEHNGVGAKNHMYKILGGGAFVGELGLLPLIVKSLNLDYDAMLQAVRDDKMEHKGWKKSKVNKTVQEISGLLERLSAADQKETLRFVKLKSGENRTHYAS
jgi:hypothetical protein